MKKIILVLLFWGIQITLLNAQNEKVPPQGMPDGHQPKDRISLLKGQLNLSDEQAKKIETIFGDSRKQREVLMKKQQEEMEKCRKEMDVMTENSEKEILSVLSDEQKTEYKLFREEKNNRRNMPHPMERMDCPLNGMENQNPPMMPMEQMGRQNNPMMQMQPMGQFGVPEMGPEGFMPGRIMPPPPRREMRDSQNAQQDKPAVYKGKKGAKKSPATDKEKAE